MTVSIGNLCADKIHIVFRFFQSACSMLVKIVHEPFIQSLAKTETFWNLQLGKGESSRYNINLYLFDQKFTMNTSHPDQTLLSIPITIPLPCSISSLHLASLSPWLTSLLAESCCSRECSPTITLGLNTSATRETCNLLASTVRTGSSPWLNTIEGQVLLELGELLGGSFSLSSKEEDLQVNPETGFLEKVIIISITSRTIEISLIAYFHDFGKPQIFFTIVAPKGSHQK